MNTVTHTAGQLKMAGDCVRDIRLVEFVAEGTLLVLLGLLSSGCWQDYRL